jgi:two-component system nitrate/nitrite response regulator NarL
MVMAAQSGPYRRSFASRTVLSQRERQVLGLIAEGLTDSQIAVQLGVRQPTVSTFVKRVFAKLGVVNRAAAAAVGVRRGLI